MKKRVLCVGHGTRSFVAVVALMGSVACASAGPTPARPATEVEWRTLALPRQEAAAGAARLSVSGVEVLGQPAWSVAAPIDAGLALTELVVAGLLRRGDVRFVERRRFTAAVTAEQSGVPRAAGAPPAGISAGAELL